MTLRLRPVEARDAAAIAAIYAPIVRDTAISFELAPPDADEIARRIRELTKTHPWIVGEDARGVAGYAYASTFRTRPAYRFAAEVTVYVRADARRTGVGRALYVELLRRLAAQGFRTAVAGIALPNGPSVALHESLGFAPVGVFRRIGFKFDRWHDLGFWEKPLLPYVADPAEPAGPTP
jgi:L-amino acid N-acyltransferase YncA